MPCKTCGADLDIGDPNGSICTACGKFEINCTCNPVVIVGTNPPTDG
jgi:hypothetical protein